MPRYIAALSFFAVALLSQSASAQVAKIDTAAKLLPPGSYECKMGSYAFRECEIVAKGEGVELVIPAGLGHFIELRAELLASDDKGQLTLLGAPTSHQNLCDACPDSAPSSSECTGEPADRRACKAQPLVARLKASGGGAKGTLMYYILRPSYTGGEYTGYFKLGNTIDLTIRPKKK